MKILYGASSVVWFVWRLMIFCPFCGNHLSLLPWFCISCGRSLEFLKDTDQTEGPSAQGTAKQPENAKQSKCSIALAILIYTVCGKGTIMEAV